MRLSEALIRLNDFDSLHKVRKFVQDELVPFLQKPNKFGDCLFDVCKSSGRGTWGASGIDNLYAYFVKISINPKKGTYEKLYKEWYELLQKQGNEMIERIKKFCAKNDVKFSQEICSEVKHFLKSAFICDTLSFQTQAKVAKAYCDVFEEILDAVKIGMSEDRAIENIVRMCSSLRGVDGKSGGRAGKFFDPVTEKECRMEIDVGTHTLKLRGTRDIYISFKDGKVKGIQL